MQVLKHGVYVGLLTRLQEPLLVFHHGAFDDLGGQGHGRANGQCVALGNRDELQQVHALQRVGQRRADVGEQRGMAVSDLNAAIGRVEQSLGTVRARTHQESAGDGNRGLPRDMDQQPFDAHGMALQAGILSGRIIGVVQRMQPIKVLDGEPQRTLPLAGCFPAKGQQEFVKEIRWGNAHHGLSPLWTGDHRVSTRQRRAGVHNQPCTS